MRSVLTIARLYFVLQVSMRVFVSYYLTHIYKHFYTSVKFILRLVKLVFILSLIHGHLMSVFMRDGLVGYNNMTLLSFFWLRALQCHSLIQH